MEKITQNVIIHCGQWTKKCTICNSKWTKSRHSHCTYCCQTYKKDKTHNCQSNIKSQIDTTNIIEQQIIIPQKQIKTDSICKKCKTQYNIGDIHCCKCNTKWNSNYKITHCNNCCLIYDKMNEHCCKCKFVWNTNDKNTHCNNCCLIYDKINEHCCKCKKEIDMNYDIIHCDKCCVMHDKNDLHCCKCKKIWDKNSTHCCKCKISYQKHDSHCCECKNTWNISDIKNNHHCDKCCSIHDMNSFHCCLCKNISKFSCNCSKIKIAIYDKISPYLKKHNIPNKNFMFSPCLDTNCGAITKFTTTINKLGFSEIYDLLAQNTFDIVFHGTKTISNGSKICCENYDILRRSGQAHGPGEYFAKNLNVPQEYAAEDGCIIINIIIKNIPTTKYISRNEWYVVNNSQHDMYVLPVGIIKYKKNIDKCDICPKIKIQKKLYSSVLYDNTSYDQKSTNIIIDNIINGIMVFEIKVNKNIYTIDINQMLQINKSSGFKRTITFV
jgi:hypothetical protein